MGCDVDFSLKTDQQQKLRRHCLQKDTKKTPLEKFSIQDSQEGAHWTNRRDNGTFGPTFDDSGLPGTYRKISISIATICSTLKYPRLSSIMLVMLSFPGS